MNTLDIKEFDKIKEEASKVKNVVVLGNGNYAISEANDLINIVNK